MSKQEIIDAIKYFEQKIKNQGIVVNARDEEHLAKLKELLKEL